MNKAVLINPQLSRVRTNTKPPIDVKDTECPFRKRLQKWLKEQDK